MAGDGTLALVSLVLAALSLVLAALSLGWQVAAFLLQGARARVYLQHGALGRGSTVAHDVRRGQLRDITRLAREGFTEEVLAVKLVNHGRAPVTVVRYGCRHDGSGTQVVPVADAIGPPLPHRIEPQSSETWYAHMTTVRALVDAATAVSKPGRSVHMTVELGTGKELRTRSVSIP